MYIFVKKVKTRFRLVFGLEGLVGVVGKISGVQKSTLVTACLAQTSVISFALTCVWEQVAWLPAS